jgi:RsiW-degrading membrane proteinase PrsW (M82 family)
VVARNPHSGRVIAGAGLYALLMLVGAVILLVMFVIQPLSGKNFDARFDAMVLGALLAFPPLVIYLWVPWIIDRFDPEPWWCLGLALLWGGVAAAGFSGLINTAAVETAEAMFSNLGRQTASAYGDVVGACISAPLVEEFWKGLAVFGIFFFLRREFDGVVDGIIYGTFAALGFAATENVMYYSRAQLVETLGHQDGALATAFVLRGVLSPWGHPLYTSMTGIGFGIARETEKTWLKWMAPVFGYLFAAFLHAVWNGAATVSGMLVMLMLPLWLLFNLAFLGIIIWLVMRKGRIIRDNLRDEVLIGTMSQEELDLICSPVGRIRATFRYGGSVGRRFVSHGARLGLCKWHAARAIKGKKETISMGFIVPLRQELAKLRYEMFQRMGRAPSPQPAWSPQGHPQQGWHQPPPGGWQGPPGGGPHGGGGHQGGGHQGGGHR